MRYSAALYLALASGWATEHEAFRPLDGRVRNQFWTHYTPSGVPLLAQSLTFSNNLTSKNGDWKVTSSRSTRLFADPHPPDQPPTKKILSLGNTGMTFFAKKAEIVDYPKDSVTVGEIEDNAVESTTGNALDAPEVNINETIPPSMVESPSQVDKGELQPQEEEEETVLVADSVETDQQVEAIEVPQGEEEAEPAKPFMTPEQQEEFRQAMDRFIREVLVSHFVFLFVFLTNECHDSLSL